MVGDEASKLRSMLEISYPMQNGIVRYVHVLYPVFAFDVKSLQYVKHLIETGKTCVTCGTTRSARRR